LPVTLFLSWSGKRTMLMHTLVQMTAATISQMTQAKREKNKTRFGSGFTA
jgi:hypothetical protein